jgi:IS5 family transposase
MSIVSVLSSENLTPIDYRINHRLEKFRSQSDHGGQDWERAIEHQKSSVRSKVEHPFRFVKVQCGFQKTVYRGIAKNINRLHLLFASSNLWMCAKAERTLPCIMGQLCPIEGNRPFPPSD